MKMRSCLLALVVATSAVLSPVALGAESFAVTPAELALLPPYCQAKYGADRNNAAAQQRWSDLYGLSNWRNMHHYCDALKSIVRANRNIGNRADLRYDLMAAQHSIAHLLSDEQTPDWILRSEALVKLGKVQLRLARMNLGNEGQAAGEFEKAIAHQPDYAPAYMALSDYYRDKGMKAKALGIAGEGLRHTPDSKPLLRRFSELGGKTPPPPIAKAVVETDKPVSSATPDATPDAAPAATPPTADSTPTPPEHIGIPSDPWCRFCPDIGPAPAKKSK